MDFSLFIKDMEFCDSGLNPSLIWAISLAVNVFKALIVNGLSSPEQIFQKYCKMQGILTFDEFRQAFEELHLQLYHTESELREFFNHVQVSQTEPTSGTSGALPGSHVAYSKVGLSQLVPTIKKLCQSK